uniref:ATP synthase subunit a n=1 Tax=Synapturanus sp. MNHN-RA-2020.0079 TaxID=2877830 RepID=A0A8K1H862_9NEOB|nr:ATP synthase F0 subunit 6 [Synapturanus sp. MNHN-RA-2020.0079]
MTMNLFDQFSSPSVIHIHLIYIAMITPWLFFPTPSNRWLQNRLLTSQRWLIKNFLKQILPPISTTGHKWAFPLTSLLLFLIGMNILGLLPYTFTPTTQLSTNLAVAFPFWLATVIIGFKNQTTMSIAHLLPEGTPTLLIPPLIIVETISLLIRPLTLSVRLTANMTAGHLLIQLSSMASMALISSPLMAPLVLIALLLLTILEIAVAIIQAYVFVLLLSLYLQENT